MPGERGSSMLNLSMPSDPGVRSGQGVAPLAEASMKLFAGFQFFVLQYWDHRIDNSGVNVKVVAGCVLVSNGYNELT